MTLGWALACIPSGLVLSCPRVSAVWMVMLLTDTPYTLNTRPTALSGA